MLTSFFVNSSPENQHFIWEQKEKSVLNFTYIFVSGCETVHGELQTQGLSGEGVPYVGGSEGFSVQEIHDVSKVQVCGKSQTGPISFKTSLKISIYLSQQVYKGYPASIYRKLEYFWSFKAVQTNCKFRNYRENFIFANNVKRWWFLWC